MSQASSSARSGDVNFTDPNSAKSWVPWAIAGAVVLGLVFLFTRGKGN